MHITTLQNYVNKSVDYVVFQVNVYAEITMHSNVGRHFIVQAEMSGGEKMVAWLIE